VCHHRCVNYDTEIRRLEALRGTPEMEFRQLFLVKESLALMFQMMQLPGESLVQYEELELLLNSGIFANLAENDWPLIPVDTGASSSKKSRPSVAGSAAAAAAGSAGAGAAESAQEATTAAAGAGGALEEGGAGATAGGSATADGVDREVVSPPWVNVCQQGSAVLAYSINNSRMKVLKNKVSMLELQQYVFARECFFLLGLNRLSLCAEKAVMFIQSIQSQLDRAKPPPRPVPAAAPSAAPRDASSIHLVDLWAVVAAVHVARGCREHILATLTRSATIAAATAASIAASQSSAHSPATSPAPRSKRAAPLAAPLDSTALAAVIDDITAMRIRDSARYLSDLLLFSRRRLVYLLPRGKAAFPMFRRRAMDLTESFVGWDSYASLTERYPEAFRDVEIGSVLEAAVTGVKSEEVVPAAPAVAPSSPGRSRGRQRLFSDSIENLEDVSRECYHDDDLYF
jgi:hypothetical protein